VALGLAGLREDVPIRPRPVATWDAHEPLAAVPGCAPGVHDGLQSFCGFREDACGQLARLQGGAQPGSAGGDRGVDVSCGLLRVTRHRVTAPWFTRPYVAILRVLSALQRPSIAPACQNNLLNLLEPRRIFPLEKCGGVIASPSSPCPPLVCQWPLLRYNRNESPRHAATCSYTWRLKFPFDFISA